MNKAILMGRLTRDPEAKTTQSGTNKATFTIAIDRRFQKPGEERQADFINCVAWGKQADLIAEHFRKGSRICVAGSIQTRKYEDKDKRTVYVTEVVVDELEFVDPKKSDTQNIAPPSAPIAPDDAELPFDL